jgi:hypothetical protein
MDCQLGARSLSAELQKILNEKSEPKVIRFGTTFSPGDKVLQIVDNYEKEVYNGDIGVIATIDMEEGRFWLTTTAGWLSTSSGSWTRFNWRMRRRFTKAKGLSTLRSSYLLPCSTTHFWSVTLSIRL